MPRVALVRTVSSMLRKPIGQRTLAVLAMRILGLALGFATSLLLGSVLGATAFGIFAISTASGLLIGLVIRLGAHYSIVRDLANAGPGETIIIVRRNALQWLVLSAATACPLFFATLHLPGLFAPAYLDAFRTAALLAPLISAVWMLGHVAQGCEKTALSVFVEFLLVPLMLLAGLLFQAWNGNLHLTSALSALLVAWTLGAIAAFLIATRCLSPRQTPDWHTPHGQTGNLRSCDSLVLFAGSGFAIVAGRVEIIVLAALLNSEAAGLFAMALKFAMFSKLPDVALSRTVMPAIAKVNTSGTTDLQHRLELAARTGFLSTLAIGLAASLAGWLVLPAFAPDFSGATPLIIGLSAGYILAAAVGNSVLVLAMKGDSALLAALSLSAVMMFFLLLWTLVPVLGAWGAVVATHVAQLVLYGIAAHYAWKRHHLRTDIFSRSGRQEPIPCS